MISLPAILILTVAATLALAQDAPSVATSPKTVPEKAVESVKPVMGKLDASHYRIGKVTFEQKTREIRFPAKVSDPNMRLEYLIVQEKGKLYESLLSTDISPTHLNLAFTLLRYPASRELYVLPTKSGEKTSRFPIIPDDIKSGARISISVEWKVEGKTHQVSVNEWIRHAVKTTAMPEGPWVYGGSEFHDGKFDPETTGDIVAILTARSALVNYPGQDNQNGEEWWPFLNRMPPPETEVTVVITPYQPEPSKLKP